MKLVPLLVIVAATVGQACSHPAATSTPPSPGAAPRPARNRNSSVITAEELAGLSVSTLEDAVRALRPHWLTIAPTTVLAEREGTIVVYQDRIRLGGPEALRQINPSQVKEVRFYGPSEATAVFGPGHMHGAIQVVLVYGR